MTLAASCIAVGDGHVPSIILNGQSEFTLEGVFDTAEEALAVAVEAVDAIRAETRAEVPEGYSW